MLNQLIKQIVLITGGTGKVGSILVNGLVQAGHFVIFTSRNADKIKQLESKFPKATDNFRGILIDHSFTGSTDQLIKQLDAEQLYPTALINNVRSIELLKSVGEYGLPTDAAWLMEFNLAIVVATALSIKLSHHPKTCLSNIINISSMYGVTPPNLNLYSDIEHAVPIHYGVAKAAQIHLSKELAVRLAKKNIRVNSIAFGGIEGRASEDFMLRYAALCPQERMLAEKDIMGPVEFLLSSQSSGMTGHNLVVDGGWTVW